MEYSLNLSNAFFSSICSNYLTLSLLTHSYTLSTAPLPPATRYTRVMRTLFSSSS